MKRFSVGLVLLLLSTFSIFAQNKVITVSGRVVESDSKKPAAQATVQLLSLPDSAYAAGIASNNQGWFTLPKVKGREISFEGILYRFPHKVCTSSSLCEHDGKACGDDSAGV